MVDIRLNISYIILANCTKVVRNGETDETAIKPSRDI